MHIPSFILTHADQTNGAFETVGSLFSLNNSRVLLKDKMVAGVSVISTFFFFLWGVWNTIWYPHLNQPWSFWGGVAMVISNVTWVILLTYYKFLYSRGKIRS